MFERYKPKCDECGEPLDISMFTHLVTKRFMKKNKMDKSNTKYVCFKCFSKIPNMKSDSNEK